MIQLRRYAQMFPEFSDQLLEAAQQIHRITTTSDLTKRTMVIEAIQAGANAQSDIVDDTKLDPDDVKRIYQELVADGGYEERPIGLKTKVRRGPRLQGIFLRGDIPGSAFQSTSTDRRYQHYVNPDEDDDDEDDEGSDKT